MHTIPAIYFLTIVSLIHVCARKPSLYSPIRVQIKLHELAANHLASLFKGRPTDQEHSLRRDALHVKFRLFPARSLTCLRVEIEFYYIVYTAVSVLTREVYIAFTTLR